MTQSVKTSPKSKWSIGITVVLALTAFMYLWGVFFNLKMKQPTSDVHPLTVVFAYMEKGKYPVVAKHLEDSGMTSGLIIMVVGFLAFTRKKKDPLHGDAKWATKKDIKKSGMLGENGIIVGRVGKEYVTMPLSKPGFPLLYAPTGRGKGVGFVIPNALNWPESAVFADQKREIYDLTAGFRKQCGQEVYVLDFMSEQYKSHRWNPLHYISDNPDFMVGDVDKIAKMLIKGSEDDIWVPEARTLFRGLVLFLYETEGLYPLTLGEVYRQLNPIQDTGEYLKEMLEEHGDRLSTPCQMALSSFSNNAEKTRQGIKSQLNTALSIFANPVVDAVTSDSDFYLGDIRKKRMSIYLSTTADNQADTTALRSLFWEQLIAVNTRKQLNEEPALKHEVLLLLDEFASMGKMEVLKNSVSYIRSYGLRLAPIFQSLAQLREIYGNEGTELFLDNHSCWIVMTPRRYKQAEELANEIGFVTASSKSKGRSRSDGKTTRSENDSETKRHLILPQDIKLMDGRQSLLLVDEQKPMMVERIRWYEIDVFQERAAVQAPDLPLLEVPRYGMRGSKKEAVVEYEFDVDSVNVNIDPDQDVYADGELEDAAAEFLQSIG